MDTMGLSPLRGISLRKDRTQRAQGGIPKQNVGAIIKT